MAICKWAALPIISTWRMAYCVVTHTWLLLKEHFVCVLLCCSAVLAWGSSHKWSGTSQFKGPLCASADVSIAWLMQTYTHNFVRKYCPDLLLDQITLVLFNLESAINMDLRNIYWQLWEIITSSWSVFLHNLKILLIAISKFWLKTSSLLLFDR